MSSSSLVSATSPSTPLRLDKGWQFTQLTTVGKEERVTASDEWIATSKFPTNVHSELIQLKKIPDPFVGLHEYDVQCKCVDTFKHAPQISLMTQGSH